MTHIQRPPPTHEKMPDRKAQQALIYCRTASARQPIAPQEERCRHYAVEQDRHVTHVFSDSGISGNAKDRPGFNALLEHLKARKDGDPCIVIMEDIRRLSRDLATYAELKHAIEAAGGRIEYATFPRINTPEDRLVETIMVARAKLESELEEDAHGEQ